MISIEITLSVLAALFISVSDFLAKYRKHDRHLTYSLLMMSGIGAVCFACYGVLKNDNLFEYHNQLVIFFNFISGVTNVIALWFLYIGISRGPVSVAAPLVTLSSVFLAIKWYFLGVTLTFMGYCGAVIAVIGALLVGIRLKNEEYTWKHLWITAACGILSGFFFSSRLFFMQLAAEKINLSAVLFQARLFGALFTILIILYYFICKGIWTLPSWRNHSWKFDFSIPVLQSITGSIGIVLLLLASVGNYVVIAPTIFSINAVFTVLLTTYFFKEQFSLQRILAFLIVISGIMLLKLSSV